MRDITVKKPINYKLTKSSIPIQSKKVENFIKKNLRNLHIEAKNISHEEVQEAFKKFLTTNTNNKIDINEFKYLDYCNGTSQAISEFVARNNKRRLRVSGTDFVLSRIVGNAYGSKIVPLENEKIKKNDCVVMSFPFSGNGSYYPNYEEVLDQCDQLDVPVMIDGAYFGIGNGINYPLNHKCVTDFATSLSKCHGVQDYRIGMRFRKEYVDDHISFSREVGVFNRFAACLGSRLMSTFSHNWIIENVKPQQEKICKELNLIETNTLTFALGDVAQWPEYKRGNDARICISENFV